jgi:hypothetical protein
VNIFDGDVVKSEWLASEARWLEKVLNALVIAKVLEHISSSILTRTHPNLNTISLQTN